MKKGFTLLELLLVIAILGVMASMVYIRFTGAQAAARDARRQSDIKQFQNAVEAYANANNGIFPDGNPTVNATSLCGSGQPLGNAACVDDPRGGTNHYQYSTNAANTSYTIWATLEKPTPTQTYYVCSSGKTATTTGTFNGAGGNCP